jgi:serine protease Do
MGQGLERAARGDGPSPIVGIALGRAGAVALAAALLLAPGIAGAQDGSAGSGPLPDEPSAELTPFPPADTPATFADLVDELVPAVVNVSTTQRVGGEGRPGPEIPQFPPGSPFQEFFDEFFDERERQPRRATSLGSGFIIDPEGYIVTNLHVIEGADEITVVLSDDTNLTAEVVGSDERTDIAVLQVETDMELPYVEWGSSSRMRVGDWVVAIGNPFGLGGTVTAGIISARARDIRAGPYDDFLQTDASINRGNSGGPMFNLAGEVIGINTAIFSPSGGSIGIGFAIPSDLAQNVVAQIVEYGRTRRGWLGVRIQTVTEEIAEGLQLDEAEGALVASVTPSGPAEEAGIRPGDVIVGFDDEEIEEMRELPRVVAETPVGDTVDVTVIRRGEERTIEVTLGELEVAEEEGLLAARPGAEPPGGEGAETGRLERLGFELAPLGEDLRREYDIPRGIDGVVITDVERGSPAAEEGLEAGEVIVEVDQETVSSPSQVAERVEAAREAGRGSVLLLVSRAGDMRFIALQLDDKS